MYLLEAKKKAEKEEKAQRERDRRKAKKHAQRDEDRGRAQAALDSKVWLSRGGAMPATTKTCDLKC
jgi:hypothetical protein